MRNPPEIIFFDKCVYESNGFMSNACRYPVYNSCTTLPNNSEAIIDRATMTQCKKLLQLKLYFTHIKMKFSKIFYVCCIAASYDRHHDIMLRLSVDKELWAKLILSTSYFILVEVISKIKMRNPVRNLWLQRDLQRYFCCIRTDSPR